MRKIFKRFASLLTIFILTIMSIVPVHASENTSVVNVTDDLAIQMAERFAKGIGENSNIVANNPRKFYDTTGQAIGYIVNYNFFTNCIDRGDIAVVHCGIISSDTGERAGHSMAAEGYATLRAYNSGNTVHTLMVFDGWGDTVRYLNFDFDSWTDISGTTFNG